MSAVAQRQNWRSTVTAPPIRLPSPPLSFPPSPPSPPLCPLLPPCLSRSSPSSPSSLSLPSPLPPSTTTVTQRERVQRGCERGGRTHAHWSRTDVDCTTSKTATCGIATLGRTCARRMTSKNGSAKKVSCQSGTTQWLASRAPGSDAKGIQDCAVHVEEACFAEKRAQHPEISAAMS